MTDDFPFSWQRSPKKTFLANYRREEAEECYLSPVNSLWDAEDEHTCEPNLCYPSFDSSKDCCSSCHKQPPAYPTQASQAFQSVAVCSDFLPSSVTCHQAQAGAWESNLPLNEQVDTKPDVEQLAFAGANYLSGTLADTRSSVLDPREPSQSICKGFLSPDRSLSFQRNLETLSSCSSPRSVSPYRSVCSSQSSAYGGSPDGVQFPEKSEFEAKYLPTKIMPKMPNMLFRRVWSNCTADAASNMTSPQLRSSKKSAEPSKEPEPQEVTVVSSDGMKGARNASRRSLSTQGHQPFDETFKEPSRSQALASRSSSQHDCSTTGLETDMRPKAASCSVSATEKASNGDRERSSSVDVLTSNILLGCSGGNKNSLCQVCGDQAAGFYCGAYICEACKKFFIRASKQDKVKYTCLRDKNCVITKENRVQCQYCRYQKCLSFNMYCPKNGKRTLSDAGIGDIPCRVCGSPSSGFHFGTLTCEGCKGFFRRMAKEREPESYRCSKNGECQINSMTRNICKACRYQKCLSVGMSLSASRIGRQPNSVKHAISLEVKRQQPQQAEQTEAQMEAMSDIEMSRRMDYIPVTLASSPRSYAFPAIYPISPLTKTFHLTRKVVTSHYIQKQEAPDPDVTTENSSTNSKTSSSGEDSSLDPIKSLEKETIYRSLNSALIDLHNIVDTCPINDQFNERRFSCLSGLWEEMMDRFHRHAKNVIKFAKKVAGFRSINIEDQVTLVQIASYPIVILNFSRQFDLETGYYNYFGFSKQEEMAIMNWFPLFNVLQQHFRHCGFMVKTLAMDEMEIALTSALLLVNDANRSSVGLPGDGRDYFLSAECMNLKDREKIRSLQEELLDCFRDYEEKTYEKGQERFGTILLRIAEFALFSVQHGQVVSTLTQTYPELVLPQLYQDMYVK